MNFSEILNYYIEKNNSSSKELAIKSGISASLISRYRNGKRKPKKMQLEKLIDGLYQIINENNTKIDKNNLINEFENALDYNNTNYEIFRNNFNRIINELNINIDKLAQGINYDSSFVYRIKNGERKPASIEEFIDDLVTYLYEKYKNINYIKTISSITNIKESNLSTKEDFNNNLKKWFLNNKSLYSNTLSTFLNHIDEFDIKNYSDNTKEKNIPTTPIILPSNKNYYGIKGMNTAETEFIKTTLLSKSKEDIFMYSEMPMTEITSDTTLQKKLIIGMSLLLKKGIHLNIIHNINRPLDEMIVGLESWLPIYMLGDISPYYYEKNLNKLFLQMHCTSGSIALIGECPKNSKTQCKLYTTTKKEELQYYKSKSKILLEHAKPLMKIIKNEDDFNNFISKYKNIEKIETSIYKNIDFYNSEEFIVINKKTIPKIHFIIYNQKLKSSINQFIINK